MSNIHYYAFVNVFQISKKKKFDNDKNRKYYFPKVSFVNNAILCKKVCPHLQYFSIG